MSGSRKLPGERKILHGGVSYYKPEANPEASALDIQQYADLAVH
jgi:hypothetical protein